MDYEKLYKKSLERASKLRFQNPFDTVSQMVEYIFPELKESEDERIRKWIIDDIIYNMDNEPLNNSEYKKEAEKAIAWLEKLCYKPQSKTALEAAKEEKVDNANKVEPKFKVGDWVIDKDDKGVFYITRIEENFVTIADIDGDEYVNSRDAFEVHFILWTIKDAKPGDVLYSPSHRLVWIYKDNEHYHASINLNYAKVVSFDNEIVVPSDVCPANRVQRSILFQKMEESNYKWDAEKKELRKIEQKLASSAKTCKNDTLLDLLNKMPSYITVDGLDYHFVLKKIGVYIAYYECEGEEGRDKIIFWMAGDPVDLLTEMLEKLKEEGLLE